MHVDTCQIMISIMLHGAVDLKVGRFIILDLDLYLDFILQGKIEVLSKSTIIKFSQPMKNR